MYKKRDIKTAYYLRMLLVVCCIINCILSLSQESQKTTFHCYLNHGSGYYTDPKISIEEVTANGATYQIIVAARNTGKKIEQYFRHSDSSFLFLQFDSTEKLIKQGLLASYYTGIIDTVVIQIPDIGKDPDGTLGLMKDTAFIEAIHLYKKTGIWQEKDSLGNFWRGSFLNGKREGKWERALPYYSPDYPTLATLTSNFHPFDFRNFKEGKEQPMVEFIELWPYIEGKWYIQNKDTDVLYLTTNESKINDDSTIVWHFTSKSRITLKCPPKQKHIKPFTYLLSCNWKQENNKLLVELCDHVKTFELVDFTPTYMILKPLPDSQLKIRF